MSAFLPILPPAPSSTRIVQTPLQTRRQRSSDATHRRQKLPCARRLAYRCSSSLPQSYDQAGSGHSAIGWKDRVALYAQFSAEETLDALLEALQANARSGPQKDDGIDALYAFANLDIWALTHRFFGKKMDLGQFERFKRVLVANPYDILLHDYTQETLSALHVSHDTYVSRRAFHATARDSITFVFSMKRTAFGGEDGGKSSWMVDSIIRENV